MNGNTGLQAKQAFLRQHISEDQYEEFGEYCESVAGDMDIESWDLDYVRQLVKGFIRVEASRLRKHNSGDTFHSYQSGANTQPIKEIQQKQQQPQPTKPAPQPPMTLKQKQDKGAIGILDSIFEESQESHRSRPEQVKYNKAAFDSMKFWELNAFASTNPKQQEKAHPPLSSTQPLNFSSKQSTKIESASQQLDNFEKMFQSGFNTHKPVQLETQAKAYETQKPVRQDKGLDMKPMKMERKEVSKGVPHAIKAKPQPKPIEQKPKKTQQPQRASKARESNFESINIGGSNTVRERKFEEVSIDQPPLSVTMSRATQPEPQKDSKDEKHHSIKLVSVSDIKTSKVAYQGPKLIKKPLSTSIPCFRSFQRGVLAQQNLKVRIKDHEIITRSFFSSDYPMYHLHVTPVDITCKRNYEDFEKLQTHLQNVYPGVRLPYLEKKGWLQSETGPQLIQKQKKYFTTFLQDVLSHSQLRNSRILEDFLTLKDHKQIKRKFEEYDKLKKINCLEELCLLDGKVRIELTEQTRQYNEHLARFREAANAKWDSCLSLLERADQQHKALAETYSEVLNVISAMRKDVKEFDKKVVQKEFFELEKSLEMMGKMVKQTVTLNEQESSFFGDKMLPFMRYEKSNMQTLVPLIENCDKLTKEYLSRAESEKDDEKTDYLSERLKEYKGEVLEGSSHIVVLKHQCGYLQHLLSTEGHHFYRVLAEKVRDMVSEVSKGKMVYFGKYFNTLTALVDG